VNDVRYLLDPSPSDRDLRRLWRRVWDEEAPRTLQPVLQRSLVHAGAYLDEQLVGFANVATDGGIHGFLSDVLVDPDHQRRGIGTGLVSRVRDAAKARGITWLHVDFDPELRPFYRRAGFTDTAAGVIRFSPE
jgi:GNAT superfamily N-acetyltransferase